MDLTDGAAMGGQQGRWLGELHGFCTEFAFPPAAEESLTADLVRLCTADPPVFPAAMARYEEIYRRTGAGETGEGLSHEKALRDLSGIAETAGVSPFAAHMLFYILLSPLLREIYRREKIPEEIFRHSMEDLRCKLYECRQVYGIWGSFVASWFSRFFRLTLFGIGRLEFAPLRLSEEDAAALEGCPAPDGAAERERQKILPGAILIDTHIPSRGRLPHAEVLDSYRRAAAFFASRYDLSGTGGRAVFICESWMLDPGHFSLRGMETCENILAFQRDYRLIREGKDPAGGDLWRIFGRMVDPRDDAAVAALPEDTALRRAYKRRLLAGDLPGYGVGVYFWDPADGQTDGQEKSRPQTLEKGIIEKK